MKSSFLRQLGALVIALSAASIAHAADPFPTKPIRIIVPAAPGGALDITTRLVAQKMGERLGQTVLVENRPGAESMLGTRQAKDAPADGYTLMSHSSALAALPALKVDPGYDPVKHFTAIGPLLRAAQVMYVGGSEPDKTVPEFIARAKAQPGKLTNAHGGVGSPQHLGAAQFTQQARLDVVGVPYKGTGAALPDVAGGRVTSTFAGYAGGAPYLQSGKLRPIGVTGNQRLVALPDVPTFKEQGIDFTYYFWLGLFAPAGTPRDVVLKLADALSFATSDKDLTERFRKEGSEAMPATPDEFNAYVAKDVADMARLMRELKIQKE